MNSNSPIWEKATRESEGRYKFQQVKEARRRRVRCTQLMKIISIYNSDREI